MTRALLALALGCLLLPVASASGKVGAVNQARAGLGTAPGPEAAARTPDVIAVRALPGAYRAASVYAASHGLAAPPVGVGLEVLDRVTFADVTGFALGEKSGAYLPNNPRIPPRTIVLDQDSYELTSLVAACTLEAHELVHAADPWLAHSTDATDLMFGDGVIRPVMACRRFARQMRSRWPQSQVPGTVSHDGR